MSMQVNTDDINNLQSIKFDTCTDFPPLQGVKENHTSYQGLPMKDIIVESVSNWVSNVITIVNFIVWL